jgi:50S ribosomal subunit-associated GTPase HflX
VFISATRGINILGLKDEVLALFEKEFVEETFRIPQENQKLISRLHATGEVLERVYEENQVILRIRIKRKDRERLGTLIGSQ